MTLYLVPRADQDDDDFMEAVVELGARIGLQAPQPPMTPEQEEPPPTQGNVISFTAYADNLPVWIPLDENGHLEKDERLWVTLDKDGQPRKPR